MNQTLKQDEFFKFYFVYMLITAVVSVTVNLLTLLFGEAQFASSTIVFIIGIITNLMSVVAFVCSIVAIVLVYKRHYQKKVLWLPIGAFVLSMLGFVVGIVVSILTFKDLFTSGSEPTPEEIQAISEQISNHPPLAIIIYPTIQGIIIAGLAIWLLIVSRRETGKVTEKLAK